MLLAACSTSSSGQVAQTYAVYQFTCCLGSDVQQTWHPGSTVQLHWIATLSGQTTSTKPIPLKLSVQIAGAYSDVATLKQQGAPARTVVAPAIAIDDRTSTPPVSTIALPADLPPGLYNLTFKVDFGRGNSMSAASIVQVGP